MKQIINTPDAPAPIGPYNQAVISGNMLFISGQIALPVRRIFQTPIRLRKRTR